MEKRRLLVVVAYSLFPPHDGGRASLWNKIRALSSRYDIDVVSEEPVGFDRDREKIEAAFAKYCRSASFFRPGFRPFRNEKASRLQWFARAMCLPEPLPVADVIGGDFLIRIEEAVRRRKPDLLLFEHSYAAAAAAPLRRDSSSATSRLPWILVEYNVESDVWRESASFRGQSLLRRFACGIQALKTARMERRIHALADVVLYISDHDRKRFPGEDPSRQDLVSVFAPELAARKNDFSSSGEAVFFGTLGYFPNFEGLAWLVDEVWPRVVEAVPGARLTVLDALPDFFRRRYRGHPSVSFAPSASHAEMDRRIVGADFCVAPIRLGSGIKIKNVVAMNLGMPIVGTSPSFQGMPVVPGRDALLADEAEKFAEAMISLFGSEPLRRSLGTAAHALYRNTYAWGAATDRWDEVLGKIFARFPAEGRGTP